MRTGDHVRFSGPPTGIGPSNCVAFTPDGRKFAAGGQGEIRVWNVGDGQTQHKLKVPGAAIVYLTFTADGKTLAALARVGLGIREMRIHEWDVGTGKPTRRLPTAGKEGVGGYCFSPD